MQKGILLVNLGTPEEPTPEAVKSFLAEFLSDRRVIRWPRGLWLPILHGIVLQIRPKKQHVRIKRFGAKKALRYGSIPNDKRNCCKLLCRMLLFVMR